MRERILYQFLLEADNESGRLRNMLHIGQNVKKSSVVNAALKIVLDIVTKIIYVLLFMYIPYTLPISALIVISPLFITLCDCSSVSVPPL